MSYDNPHRLAFDAETIRKTAEKNKQHVFEPTGMGFMDDHYGLRPGCLHTLMGSTGRGKSTLVQSLIVRWGTKAKMLLYLTEESSERVEYKLSLKDEDVSFLTPKLHILHEQSVLTSEPSKSPRAFLTRMREALSFCEAKILIVDNITTSAFYEQLNWCGEILQGLRQIAQDFDIAVVIIAHTKKGVSEATKGLMSPDDIRGTNQLAMTSDYFYIFYRIRKTLEYGQPLDSAFVYVAKARDHDNQDNIYKLDYDSERKRYFKDRLVNFDIFKSFMKERDRA